MKKTMKYMLFALFLALILWTLWANTALELNCHEIYSPVLPQAFEGFRIAQVSDLHNARFGEGNTKLLSLLKEAAPDIIVITGDVVDCNRTDIDTASNFVTEAMKIAPCYYVTGNHEAALTESEYRKLEAAVAGCGAEVLRDRAVSLERSGSTVCLVGLDDPGFIAADKKLDTAERIQSLVPQDGFTVLLAHRPEHFEAYCRAGVELVFSGHAHGGQVRLPVVGGLYAPGQGLLPQYDAGLYTRDDTAMLVSRGIGNSLMPLRFNNRPEIIIAILHSE